MITTISNNRRSALRRIANAVTDQELFTSPYLAQKLNNLCYGRFSQNRRISVNVDFNNALSYLAYTTGTHISINADHQIIHKMNLSREERYLLVLGLLAHENGHIYFTDFKTNEKYVDALEKTGLTFPEAYVAENATEQEAVDYYNEILTSTTTGLQQYLITISHDILNILEDSYIEYRIMEEYEGSFRRGLIYARETVNNASISAADSKAKNIPDFVIFRNCLLKYVTTGEIDETADKGILDLLNSLVPDINFAIRTRDFISRVRLTNKIIVKSYDYLRPLLNNAAALRKLLEMLRNLFDVNASGLSSDCSSTPIDNESSNSGNNNNSSSNGNSNDGNSNNGDSAKSDKANSTGSGRTDNNVNSSSGSSSESSDASDDAEIRHELGEIVNDIAECEQKKNEERNFRRHLQETNNNINYGDVHKGFSQFIEVKDITDDCKTEYGLLYREIAPTVKRLERMMRSRIKRRKNTGVVNGLYYGRRLDTRTLYRDGGHFKSRKVRGKEIDLAVAVLIDQSGSMDDMHKMDKSVAAAAVLLEYAELMNISLSMYSHNSSRNSTVYVIRDAEYPRADDRYRLMNLIPNNSNRDGMALRYVMERLSRRQEADKLCIIISDGQPAGHNGYYGEVAYNDLKNIKSEYKRKGINLIAAAIGDDKDIIEYIYGNSFLDISDLSKMPDKFVELIERFFRI